MCSLCRLGLSDFCMGRVSVHKVSAATCADESSDLLESFLAFLCHVLIPCEGAEDAEGVIEVVKEEEKKEESVTGMSKMVLGIETDRPYRGLETGFMFLLIVCV